MSLATTESVAEIKARNKQLIDEVLKVYPEKTAKRRAKHLNVHEAGKSDCGVKSNLKSIPGVMTIRGCAYAGSKGVVWGPIKDMIHISHGPVGCGQYSWAARRNYYIGTTGIDTFVTMQFTSDFQEKDIVFGGDKKLAKIIDEIQELFPLNHGITIQSECPIGLIGDDIEAVSKVKSKEYDGKTIVPVRCEGFRGVSQSLGHHIANDAVRDWIFDKVNPEAKPAFESTPYDVAIIGDYNIGGDAWSSRILLEEMGLRVIAQWSGDGSLAELEATPKAKLNVLHCYRSMNYISPHGGEVRHSLVRIQFLRTIQDRGITAQDRELLRRQDQGGRRARHREISAADGRGDRQVSSAPRRQDGDAVRRRTASPARDRRL
jgi:nitrogenase molybdenum-iron protein alpha chain